MSSTTVEGTSTNPAIRLFRTFSNPQGYTDVTLNFRNSVTDKPIYLNNVALSLFDIDKNVNSGTGWDDYVVITGATKNSTSFSSTFHSLTDKGSKVTNLSGLRLAANSTNFNCSTDLNTQCQGSISFSEPVSSVTIRYYNTSNVTTPTAQRIEFRLDNYCFNPEYTFSGIVFDDNGGIPEASANKDNADITSSNSVYTNKPKFFNGIYDPTASETGISGSTVELTTCTTPSTVFATKSVGSGTTIGQYQISISKTTLGSNTNLCLVESRTGTSYPIRTSNESRTVGFSTTTYNYPNNDFGRVVAANRALVLRKAQYVNDCPNTLDYTADSLNTPDNPNPRSGFSEDGINGSNLIPDQCIAYRITATNRANLPITDFVMQDTLQKKGIKGALITSVLIGPIHNADDYATDSIAIGENGTVTTKKLSLDPRKSRNFYFNTKYGTTNGNNP
ncbi:hypothetical protein [uncultured Psychrobacter sp.]|uniref:hypothetical protein n=1 Tax=uncultured Psychrobacter sp. TaxID=259303 RepID=UPI002623DA0F|nr:hypothetical protein [uncultured Psychrobacter sp.]